MKKSFMLTLVGVILPFLFFGCPGSNSSPDDSKHANQWGTPQPIDTNAVLAHDHQIAVDSAGNAIAVWSDVVRNPGYSIWASRYDTAAGRWSTGQRIQTDPTYWNSHPQVAVSSSGSAVVVWSHFNGSNTNVWANRFNVGTDSWGSAEQIETIDTGNAYNLRVAIDNSGNAIAVWSKSDGSRRNIWANRYEAGAGSWGAAELIENDNSGDARYPQVCFDRDGNAIAVWIQSDGSRFSIWVNRYDAVTGSWGAAELIENDNSGDARYPQVGLDRDGNAIAAWTQSDGNRYNSWANRYDAIIGSWGAAELIQTDNIETAENLRIGVDREGNALAVWNQWDGRLGHIRANRYDAATGSWGVAELIQIDNTRDAIDPQISVNSTGNAMAIWIETGESHFKLWDNCFDTAIGSWGAAEMIETNDGDVGREPQVVFDGTGNAIVIWRQYEGSKDRSKIWANRYE
jgi:hypothetical protein